MKWLNIFFIAALCVLVSACIIMVFRKNKKQYDERQKISRGNAYKWGFVSMVIFNLWHLLISLIYQTPLMDTDIALFISMFVGIVVCVVYSIWTDAFFGLDSKSPFYFLILSLILAVSNVFGAVNNPITENGILSISAMNLVNVIVWSIILVNLIAKMLFVKFRKTDDSD